MKKKTTRKPVKKLTIRNYQDLLRKAVAQSTYFQNQWNKTASEVGSLTAQVANLRSELESTFKHEDELQKNLAFRAGMVEVYERFHEHNRQPKQVLGMGAVAAGTPGLGRPTY